MLLYYAKDLFNEIYEKIETTLIPDSDNPEQDVASYLFNSLRKYFIKELGKPLPLIPKMKFLKYFSKHLKISNKDKTVISNLLNDLQFPVEYNNRTYINVK